MPPGRPALSGIFVVRVHGLSPDPLPAVASLGTRPAVESNGAWLLETHVLDWQGDAYGRLVRVEFLRKLRDEAHYDTLDALTAQIHQDAAAARTYFDLPSRA
jgi:riboflavin kinase/FMN adenylyltransferase